MRRKTLEKKSRLEKTYTILRLNIRALLLRPLYFPEKHVEVMLRVIVVFLRRERGWLRDMGRSASHRCALRIRRLGVLSLWLDTLCMGGGRGEGSRCGRGAAEKSAGPGWAGERRGAEGGAGWEPEETGRCTEEHCGYWMKGGW